MSIILVRVMLYLWYLFPLKSMLIYFGLKCMHCVTMSSDGIGENKHFL